MNLPRVALLRGGQEEYFDSSFKAGGEFVKAASGHVALTDVFISKDGQWYTGGVATSPQNLFRHVDLVMPLLYGAGGESGVLQKLLDDHGMPYSGSTALASSIAYQKHLTKKILSNHGIATPKSWAIREETVGDIENLISEVRRSCAPPWVVKPSSASHSVGISLVWDPHKLAHAIEKALFLSDVVLIEEYVRGDEVTVLSIEQFRDQSLYTFFPAHIRERKSWDMYDQDAKKGAVRRIDCPSALPRDKKEYASQLARTVHNLLGARDISQVDMIISPRGTCTVLELDTVPEFSTSSPARIALEASGVSLGQLLAHLSSRAMSR